ncbi:class I SAM-dependent methyltransferase [Methylobacterium sp. WL120]|uniref:class I SAM-dependent methyltransferase n=1 Tax=Methylobacterium sp. WL120 TaxID=2603887 RepID=UPI0011CACA50|nr:class I SAM-dependent methyltransferase [Methylobacterium sp. WL120]TXM69767.1 class I SAM-dependent methyltransferase [Methylobacterium sp. WL120]
MGFPLEQSSDFSTVAARYDATREIPGNVLSTCYDRLIEQSMFPAGGSILDAGCGTGQISIPLAERGYAVRGIDISEAMVAIARAKLRPGWKAEYGVADVRRIPAGEGRFDAVVVSKLFMHIADWQTACRELVRVLRPGGTIVHINERGHFANSVRRHFAKRADELGFVRRFPGVDPNSYAPLIEFLDGLGFSMTEPDMADLRWRFPITYGEALDGFRERLFAEFWALPDDAYDRVLAETMSWIDAHGGRDHVEHMNPFLMVHVFQAR